jgi:uncharacterized protein YukJ
MAVTLSAFRAVRLVMSGFSPRPLPSGAMPIDRYGVLRARVLDSRTETSSTPHFQIHLRAGDVDYRAAVNVRSSEQPPDLLYLADDDFRHPVTAALTALPDGFTPLRSAPGGAALDFVRGNLFDREAMRVVPNVAPGPDNDLSEFLGHYVRRLAGDAAARAYVFGQRWGPEPRTRDKIFGFLPGNGVHDVHMNQGSTGRFAADNGEWQDGALLLHLPDAGRWVGIFLAFQSQSWGPAVVGPQEGADGRLRIVAALVNPAGPAPEAETITLLNRGSDPVDLAGWALVDRLDRRQALTGTLSAGAAVRVDVAAPLQLGNNGGTLTLVDATGHKVDGVAYTREDAAREGWTVVFT